ncbi:hypothetical protein BDQ17DRAFT_1429338 [Cyathus striatus]|nr:hypothetical protein BDQ17DRAFT_1429338 [Cyathus striatus]
MSRFTPRSAGIIVIGTSVDLVFIFLVSALYGNSRKTTLLLAMSFAAQFTAGIVISFVEAIDSSKTYFVLQGFGCLSTGSPNLTLDFKLQNIYYGLSLALYAMFSLLTFIKAKKETNSEHGGLRKLFKNERNACSPIFTSIVRDGTLYFCLLFVTAIITALSTLDNASIFPAVTAPVDISILSFTGSRLILKLRKLSYLDADEKVTAPRSIFVARSGSGRGSDDEDNEHIYGSEIV